MYQGWTEQIINNCFYATNNFDTYNNGKNAFINLIESWGYFCGNYVMQWKYPSLVVGGETIKTYKNFLEDNENYKNLFYSGAFYDLIDYENEAGDMCSGYSLEQIFYPLRKVGNVHYSITAQTYLDRFSSLYGNKENAKKTFEHNGVTF